MSENTGNWQTLCQLQCLSSLHPPSAQCLSSQHPLSATVPVVPTPAVSSVSVVPTPSVSSVCVTPTPVVSYSDWSAYRFSISSSDRKCPLELRLLVWRNNKTDGPVSVTRRKPHVHLLGPAWVLPVHGPPKTTLLPGFPRWVCIYIYLI